MAPNSAPLVPPFNVPPQQLKMFASGLVKAVTVPQAKVIDGKVFPLTLSPTGTHMVDRATFIRENRQELIDVLREYGAVLLRGWGACAPSHFAEISAALHLPTTENSCSAGPRFEVASNVFTANEAPPTERIPFHHEMAQCNAPPAVIMFFCEQSAPSGGATPIIESHLAAAYLRSRHPDVAARLEQKGVRYVRIMPPVTDTSSALGKSWRTALRVELPEEAEAALRAMGSTWTWLAGGMLRTVTESQRAPACTRSPWRPSLFPQVTESMPALLRDERSGREVFFTAAESTFNGVADEAADRIVVEGVKTVVEGVTADRIAVEGSEEGTECRTVRPEKSIIYGDGSPLDSPSKAAMLDVSAFMLRAQVAIPWQPGDALLLDNARVQHSRESFEPPRRILASLLGTLSKAHGTLRWGAQYDA